LPYSIGDTVFLDMGDTVSLHAVGGGGYGNPLERDPKKVLFDVRNELISIQNAFEDYGVVINPENLKIDWTATKKERQKLLLNQPE